MQAFSVIQMLFWEKKTPCILRNLSEGHTKIVIKSAHNSDTDSLSEVEKNTFSEEKGIQQNKKLMDSWKNK